jgi:serine phosphatase RsbU (regulator of sigma subunit)
MACISWWEMSREKALLLPFSLAPGHGMMIYSDGVSEATDISGKEYGANRLRELLYRQQTLCASTLLAACRDDLETFRRSAAKTDDVTLFVLGRS